MLIDSPEMAGNPAFSVYLSADQTGVVTGTSTKVQLDTVDFDLQSDFDNITNYRFQPDVSGYYNILGRVTIDDVDNENYVIAEIYKNGASVSKSNNYASGAGQILTAEVSCLVYLNGSTDYIELFGSHNQGTNQAFNGTALKMTYLAGYLIRRT